MSDVAPVRVRPVAPVGMLGFRGDLTAPELATALQAATGCAVPPARRIAFAPRAAAAWMSPDELLLFVPPVEASGTAAALGHALADTHHLLADVSDARSLFRLDGPGAREVLAKGAPVDLAPAAFGPGDFRRTRLGQVAVAFWMPEESVFELMCFRSVADFVHDWLRLAAWGDSLPGVLTG